MRARPRGHWAPVWLPAALLGVLAWRHRWVADDGFIDLHIADNLISGLGPVFNAGERVEAYTSPLWIALTALVGLALKPFAAKGLPPFEWISVGLGLGCSVAALAIASLASDRLVRGGRSTGPAVPFGSLAILAVVPFWDYATSGLETSLVFLWLAVTFWASTNPLLASGGDAGTTELVRRRDKPGRNAEALTGFWIGLGPLVRPDLTIFSLLFGALAIAFAEGNRRRLEILAAMAALPLGYELFRMGYFACLVPNTALAKEASLAYWSHGWIYFKNFESTYQLWVPIATMAAATTVLARRLWKAGDERSALLVAAPAFGSLLYGVYITRVGGDFLHARLLLPALFALALPVSTLLFRDFRWFGPVLIPWAIVCLCVARIPIDNVTGIDRGRLDDIALSKNEHPVTVDDYREIGWALDMSDLFKQIDRARASNPNLANASFYSSSANATIRPAQLSPWLDAQVEAVAYRGAIGLCGYAGRQRVHICDCYGLADPFASRLEPGATDQDGVWHPGRSKPGHEKRLNADWCLARTVSALDGHAPFSVTVGFVVTALGCGDLAEVQAATLEPLTWRRFWRNVWLAPRLTRLRIPQDALEVRRRFCGQGSPAPSEG